MSRRHDAPFREAYTDLQAEVARLREERDRQIALTNQNATTAVLENERANRAEAQLARLRTRRGPRGASGGGTMSDMGICRIGFGHPWYLGYRQNGHLRWLPYCVQRLIVAVWNSAICQFNGHVGYRDKYEDVPCVHCGIRRRGR